jgi:BirA family transcriptional regulator, biotin operon repressor / biotin---[acetyl-CoA-carboxylase] ligase
MDRSDALDPDEIRKCLHTHIIGSRVLVFDSVSSTNTIASEYGRNPRNNGMVILAEHQEAGRGRAGNAWVNTYGDSLLCSIVLINNTFRTELLSLAVAVATAESIHARARIKWPNDLMINGKKVGGILLESMVYPSHQTYVLGIGINCHQRADSFPEALKQLATSMDMETGTYVDRITLLRRLLASVEKWLNLAQQSPDQVIEQWQQKSIQLGHRVSLCFNGKSYTGNCIGIDPDKGLVVQLDRGGVRVFDAVHSSINKHPLTPFLGHVNGKDRRTNS